MEKNSFFNPNTNPNLKRIMETVFRDLNYLHNPVDIVKFFDRDGFLHYFETLMQSAEKSKDKADLYRNQGNEQYSQKNYVQALELYNQSICWAATGSEQLGMGYANRSAVYLSLKMYDECLKSIELARQSDYPRKIISKLDQREVKCLNEMKSPVMSSKKEFVGLKPELSYPPHEKVPFIANCLDLKVNEKYGRHIVTKTDLKVGDIVAIEQPFCGVVARDIRYNCCANCLEEHDLDLIPCSNCHSAMFCNEQCYTEARSNFHDIECPILRFLMDKYTFGDLPLMMSEEHVGFRLFIMLVKSFGTADELMKFVKDLENREENVFTINHQTNDKFDLFATILKLARNEKHEVVAMKNIIGSTTAFIYKFLLRSTALKEMFKTPEQIEFLIDLLYRLLQIAHQNSLAVHSQRKFYSIMKKKLNRACLGIYPFMSLMNHSCAPNTILHPIRHGFNNIVIISKPIKAGEQLFTSYGVHHNSVNRNERQFTLTDRYGFKCDCDACIDNYSQLDWETLSDYGFIKPIAHMTACIELQMDTIKHLIPQYCEFLNKNSRTHYPNKYTSAAEKILSMLFEAAYLDKITLVKKENLRWFNDV